MRASFMVFLLLSLVVFWGVVFIFVPYGVITTLVCTAFAVGVEIFDRRILPKGTMS